LVVYRDFTKEFKKLMLLDILSKSEEPSKFFFNI